MRVVTGSAKIGRPNKQELDVLAAKNALGRKSTLCVIIIERPVQPWPQDLVGLTKQEPFSGVVTVRGREQVGKHTNNQRLRLLRSKAVFAGLCSLQHSHAPFFPAPSAMASAAQLLVQHAGLKLKPTILVVPGLGLSWMHLHPLCVALGTHDFNVVRFDAEEHHFQLPKALAGKKRAQRLTFLQQGEILVEALNSLKQHSQFVAMNAAAHAADASQSSFSAAEASKAAEVHIVTHGTGSLVLRAALKQTDWSGMRHSRLVMLGPTNRGSVLARRVWGTSPGKSLMSSLLGDPMAHELGGCDASHYDGTYAGIPDAIKTLIIAGKGLPRSPGNPLIPRAIAHDGVVSLADTTCFSEGAYKEAVKRKNTAARSEVMRALMREPGIRNPGWMKIPDGRPGTALNDAFRRSRAQDALRYDKDEEEDEAEAIAEGRWNHTQQPQQSSSSGGPGSGSGVGGGNNGGGQIFSHNLARTVVGYGHVSMLYAPSVAGLVTRFLKTGNVPGSGSGGSDNGGGENNGSNKDQKTRECNEGGGKRVVGVDVNVNVGVELHGVPGLPDVTRWVDTKPDPNIAEWGGLE